MNAPIIRVFLVFVVLFGLLVVFTSRWTVFEAQALQDNPDNRRALLEEQRLRRGVIRAADGTLLARSERGSAGTYRRTYPAGSLFSHAIGYSFIGQGRAGLEQSRNDELTGRTTELGTFWDEIRGRRPEGNDLITTLDPDGQRAALAALQGRRGSVVAMEPETGAVKVMANVPSYDPNEVPDRLSEFNRDTENAPLLNRATQATYPPGSVFKVVTAAAALDTGRFAPDSTLDGSSPRDISGVPLQNAGGRDFGTVSLTQALTQSINTAFASVAETLGRETMGRYMERFGFNDEPPLDYPERQLSASGEFFEGELLDPGDERIDVGRMGIGQDKLQVTPLQMAMVAAAVANDGELMEPRFVDRVVDSDGRTVERIEPDRQARVMSADSAGQLQSMMENVVREGTGTAAALQGASVAGKTGTAEIVPDQDINQPWFIAFAPRGNPRIAIAVTVERTQGGQGGTVAAPIARQVLEALL